MANLPETEDFAVGTYQIETSDRVLGGPGGIANKQAEQLGNRTAWLRSAIVKIISGTTAVGSAARLATARTLKFKGSVSGSGSYDGSADTEITLTLADSGIAAGDYTKVTLNAKGLAVAGSNPTTLDGHGITDAMTRTEVDQALGGKANKATTLGGYNIVDAYTRTDIDFFLGSKADKATTLGGYGITNAYTRSDVDQFLNGKAAKATTLGGYNIVDAYNRTDIDFFLGSKADKATTLGGYGITNAYTRTEVDQFLNGKAAKATTLGGYNIVDAYTRIDIDFFLGSKAEKATSLSGYGIPIATQPDAETGAENTKPMTALRVFQAIAAAVKQATETLAGIVKLATQPEAEAGSENTKAMTALRVAQSISKRVVAASETTPGVSRFATFAEVVSGATGAIAVSPSYLLGGFSLSSGANGYIKFPNFMGGFIIQWATSDEGTSSSDYRFFPIPFPNTVFGGWLQLNSDTTNGLASSFATALQIVDNARYLWTAAGSWGGGGKAFLVALGR